MKLKHYTTLLNLVLMLFAFTLQAQDKGGEKKEEDEFAKKKKETKLTEVIETDSLENGELLKRAVVWMKVESPVYKKTSATSTSEKVECMVSFPVKPKELNPEVDYTGKITMKVVIECKAAKYRYIVSEIKHISKSGATSAGSVDNTVPECGSMAMHEQVWKKLKGEAMRGAAQVAADIKAGMLLDTRDAPAAEW